MDWIGTVITAVGSSVITCVAMEAYFQRRSHETLGENEDMEPRHVRG
jgi:hypothetical protein